MNIKVKSLFFVLLVGLFSCGADDEPNTSNDQDNEPTPYHCGGVDGWDEGECAEGEVCILHNASNGEFYSCAPAPSSCGDTPSCDCATVAEFSAEDDFDPCNDPDAPMQVTSCDSSNGRVTVSCRYYEVLVDPPE
ncbi:hypothetical protein FRC96_02340 [Lujinxingia vulgaris]|uniref:Uncharacterized protein n=1 Tax=Lujinxingia vulgaris TaxID=2600176 RepID=A0A5C6XKK9_9DELT|nr:hypothetical protein [Lujinxingia vulgaris]TXD42882.1 hypothetical protein FRC96_02340 [Lujinxingia vulgaris]